MELDQLSLILWVNLPRRVSSLGKRRRSDFACKAILEHDNHRPLTASQEAAQCPDVSHQASHRRARWTHCDAISRTSWFASCKHAATTYNQLVTPNRSMEGLTSNDLALQGSDSSAKFRKYTRLSTGMQCIFVLHDWASAPHRDEHISSSHLRILQDGNQRGHERLDEVQ